ncbi:MAG: hypothetical protein AAGD00_00175 [Planctomycetota bacterium]
MTPLRDPRDVREDAVAIYDFGRYVESYGIFVPSVLAVHDHYSLHACVPTKDAFMSKLAAYEMAAYYASRPDSMTQAAFFHDADETSLNAARAFLDLESGWHFGNLRRDALCCAFFLGAVGLMLSVVWSMVALGLAALRGPARPVAAA